MQLLLSEIFPRQEGQGYSCFASHYICCNIFAGEVPAGTTWLYCRCM